MTRNPETTEAARKWAVRREEVARAMHQAHHDRRGYYQDEPNATEAWESGGVDTGYWLALADDAVAAVLAVSPAVTGEQCPVCEGVSPVGLSEPILRAHIAHTVSASPAVTEREALAQQIEALRGYLPGGTKLYAQGFYEGVNSAASLVRAAAPSPAVTAAEDETRGREKPHTLTRYGTTNCPVEGVRANVDDGECSACGDPVVAAVPAEEEK